MPSDQIRDLEILKSDITSRLRAACEHFPDAEFEQLVNQIAQIELKYARRVSAAAPPPEC